jgi:N-methylhydantoinase B
LRYPIRIEAQRIVADTEGAGRWCGSPSVLVEYGPVDTPITVFYAADAEVNRPLGVRGGHAGPPSAQFRRKVDGELVELPPIAALVLQPAERVVSFYSGGGGYGQPRERDPELVRRDVREGWITAKRARETYGLEE